LPLAHLTAFGGHTGATSAGFTLLSTPTAKVNHVYELSMIHTSRAVTHPKLSRLSQGNMLGW